MSDETLVTMGGEVKALGGGKFEAPLIRFGSAKSYDLAKDFFDATTDYWIDIPGKVVFLYDHGQDDTLKATKLGGGTVDLELRGSGPDAGVWMKGQLDMANSFEAAIYKMAEMKKIGTSSGAVSHLVSREKVDGVSHIKSWPIFEASLTPTPCEGRNFGKVTALKSVDAYPSFKSLLAELAAEEVNAEAINALDALPPAPEPVPADVVGALKSLPFTDYLAAMGAITEEFGRRVSWVHEEQHVKQGRAISAGNAQMITDACCGMQGHLNNLMGLVNPTTVQKENAQEDGLDQSGQKADEELISAPVGQQALQAYFRHNTTDTARNFALIAQNEGGTISF